MGNRPHREIRAVYDETTIRVYQAYGDSIATAALAAGRFVAPFGLDRMSWIKPSYLWMMYRCGWATKDAGQRRVFAIDVYREAFDAWLAQAKLAKEQDSKSQVLVQWDPERDLSARPLAWRSLQMGLRGTALRDYAGPAIARLVEITDEVREIDAQRRAGDHGVASRLPVERAYPVTTSVRTALQMNGDSTLNS
jgi:hypothetical protein